MHSYKNFVSGFDRPRSEPCVQEPQLDTSNETHQGPPNDTQGYQTACYRNIVDTKPLYFSKSNSESYRKSNRKPEKAEWTEPKI